LRPTGEHSRTGVALVMVILILAGLLAIAVPLVYICRANETSAARTLDQQIARRYALSALELAKGQLRRGTYENEFRAAYPPPTAFPTPTPANVANLAPYNTPDYDAAPELIVPQAELDKAIPKVLPNGDTLSVSVEIEDEQGKLNLNSITPRLLRGLYMAVFRIDAMALSADDRAALLDRFEHLIDPMARMRFSSGSYVLIQSVESIRGFTTVFRGRTYRLTQAEFDALRPCLTVHSWRAGADGFSATEDSLDLRSNPIFDPPSDMCSECPYRVKYFDAVGSLLSRQFLTTTAVRDEATGTITWHLALRENAPQGAVWCSWVPEEFHPVNLNNAPEEVLIALALAPLDLDNPSYSLEDALQILQNVSALGRVDRIETGTNGSEVIFAPPDWPLIELNSRLFSCADRYFRAKMVAPGRLRTTTDLSAISASGSPAPVVRRVLSHADRIFDSCPPDLQDFCRGFFYDVQRTIVTLVSGDNYTIHSRVALFSPVQAEVARWEVTERVCIGSTGRNDSLPLPLAPSSTPWPEDNLFSSPYDYTSQKSRFYSPWLLDRSPGITSEVETVPGTFWYIPPIVLNGATCYSRNLRGLCTTQNGYAIFGYLYGESHLVGCGDPEIRTMSDTPSRLLSYIFPSSSSTFHSDRKNEFTCASDAGTPFSDSFRGLPFRGNLVVAGFLNAQGWVPSSDSAVHRIFSIMPASEGTKGSTSLYVANGYLSLRVEDDSGVAGTFSYRLDVKNFPADTWMGIVCHIGGNQPGQSSILVDNRLVPIEYSSTSPRTDGYCLKLRGDWPCTFPTIAPDSDADPTTLDVNSTEGYPDSGYFRVDDELLFYGSKTATSFLSLRRCIGGSIASALPVGGRILPAAAIVSPRFWMAAPPARGDRITLIQYEEGTDMWCRSSGRDPQAMTLDLPAVLDADARTLVFAAPANAAFSTTLPLSGTVMAFCGTSGTCCTGDPGTGRASIFWLAKPGASDGFAGDSGPLSFAIPNHPVFRLTKGLDVSCTSLDYSNLPYSTTGYHSFLLQIDSEIIGVKVLSEGKPVELSRGFFGSVPTSHEKGSWALPLEYYGVCTKDEALPATDKFIRWPYEIISSYRYWRIDDEIVFAAMPSRGLPLGDVPLFRGAFGSVPADHQAGALYVEFPCLAAPPIDFSSRDGVKSGALEFTRSRPGMLIFGIGWKDLAPDPFVQLHFWADVADDHDFVREPSSPNVFHFTSKSRDLSISRNGEPVISDTLTVCMAQEYLPGAWLPNDPTRHSWKTIPRIDEIDLWVREPDVVFEHREHP